MKTLLLVTCILFSCVLHAQIITTIAGNGTPGFSGEGGLAINAEFAFPAGVVTDKWGNIYIADFYNQVVQKIDTNGILTRFAGTGAGYSSGTNGTPATNTAIGLGDIVGMAVDSIGNVYFCDGSAVRQVNTSGIINTFAGNAITGGYSGDGDQASNATLEAPTGICFDRSGNMYISDAFNYNIRKINTGGIISTFAGTTIGFSGDGGPATDAQFIWPTGIASDDSGNIYIGDLYTSRVRKINAAGIIGTVAGGDRSMGHTIACEGCSATSISLYGTVGVVIDNSGNVYACAQGDNVVQKITGNGLTYTIAGNGIAGYSGDGGSAINAMLKTPNMIWLDNSGNLLIADKDNVRLRKVWMGTTYIPPVQSPTNNQFSVYPNPIPNHEFTCIITTTINEEAKIEITNMLGQQVFTSPCTTNTPTTFPLNVPPGFYFITARTQENKMQAKIVVE